MSVSNISFLSRVLICVVPLNSHQCVHNEHLPFIKLVEILPATLCIPLVTTHRPDEDYLLDMDNTQWLPRISDLLSTAFEVSQALKKDGDHVLVCYECGWDRTTQVETDEWQGWSSP